jgi:hypothetical protein
MQQRKPIDPTKPYFGQKDDAPAAKPAAARRPPRNGWIQQPERLK